MELSSSVSLESPSGSFRRDKRSRKPTIVITNLDNDSTEVEDNFIGEFDELSSSPITATRKQPVVVPQMSTLCNFVTNVNDESSNIPSSSSVSSNQPSDSTPEIEDNQITKYHGLSLGDISSCLNENDKEKLDERKKKSSLQNFRLYNMQMERTLNRHRSTDTLPSLTSAQIHLIRNIWRQVYITKGPTVIGSTLLHGIFFKSKKIKEQFFRCPFPHRFPNRDSFNKAHAKAIGELLDKIVDNLENLELMSRYLFSIGAIHANLARRQVSKEIWNLMAEAFIDCTLDWGDKKGRTEASRKAWAFIIAFVIEKIKGGHLYERRQLAYHRRSSMITPSQTTAALISLPSSAPTKRFWKSVEESNSHVQMF
ncbi:Globin family protein [Acanthocheilonema viteae]